MRRLLLIASPIVGLIGWVVWLDATRPYCPACIGYHRTGWSGCVK